MLMFGALWFIWISGCSGLGGGNQILIAQDDAPADNYSIWVDGLIQFDEQRGGVACPKGKPPIVQVIQVSSGRWQIHISCDGALVPK